MRRADVAAALVAAATVVGACGGGGPTTFRIDDGAAAGLRDVVASGLAKGNRVDVFAKVGDSITFEPGAYVPVGCGRFRWRAGDDGLREVAARFSATPVPGPRPGCPPNSFTRVSRAALPSWTAGDLLAPTPEGCAPIDCELADVRPAVALVMIGTNDAEDPAALDRYRDHLTEVVRRILAAGTVPVLSTIPPRPGFDDEVADVNEAVEDVGRDAGVPVWDLHASLGDDHLRDGVHPTTRGHEIRNRGALEVLDELWRVVLGPVARG